MLRVAQAWQNGQDAPLGPQTEVTARLGVTGSAPDTGGCLGPLKGGWGHLAEHRLAARVLGVLRP